MKASIVLVALALGGCVTPLVDYKSMSPEQISALGKDKTAAANCVVLNTPYGRGVSTYMALDKSVLEKGAKLTVDEQCKMDLQQGGLIQAPTQPQVIQILPQPAPQTVVPPGPPVFRPQSYQELAPIPAPRYLNILDEMRGMHR